MNFLSLYKRLSFTLFIKVSLIQIIRKLTFHSSFISYAQSGEDKILRTMFLEKNDGVFVDVGCNDPINLSNTFDLYLRGWTGVNIDINPQKIKQFLSCRKKDISICAAVSDISESIEYYEFESDAVNTIDPEISETNKKFWKYKSKRTVNTTSLTALLDQHLKTTTIDLLSIDVEGNDFKVLKSLDFTKYSFDVIVIEIHEIDLSNPVTNPIYSYLAERGYGLIGYSCANAYFKRIVK